ncbi:type II secretion system F family protein [Congregicoccus parvus]|uniref:type II secretion system F family protein n=1 Tax=Congregicoccus parvus TaxID=3081749 RepID=UPI003FA5A24D
MQASSSSLARWYTQLASFLEAGIGLDRAVESAGGPTAARRAELAASLRAGEGVDAAFAKAEKWLPDMDRQLMIAGAASGRLPEVLRKLAVRHEERVAASRRALLAALYPVGVAHFAVLALPVKRVIVDGDVAGYAAAVLTVLVPAWVIGIGFFALARARVAPAVGLLRLLPFVGGYMRARAVADLALALEIQIVAGIRLDIAWLQAALAAGDRRLERVAIRAAESVQAGQPVSLALAGGRELPSPFVEFWTNGEQTGRLDHVLAHLHRHFADAATRKLTAASLLYPMALFAAVAVWVAIQVIRFYAGYFEQFEQMM